MELKDLPPLQRVTLERGPVAFTFDELLWEIIGDRTDALSFVRYSEFVDRVLSDAAPTPSIATQDVKPQPVVWQEFDTHCQRLLDATTDPAQHKKIVENMNMMRNTQASREQRTRAIQFLVRKFDEVLGLKDQNWAEKLAQHAVGGGDAKKWDSESRDLQHRLRTFGVFNGDAYQLLKAATEFFVFAEAGCLDDLSQYQPPTSELSPVEIGDLRDLYLDDLGGEVGSTQVLPYFSIIRNRLAELPIKKGLQLGASSRSYGILRSRLVSPILLELIWNYWIEQGLMVQTINLVSLRFQNVRRGPGVDPLANLEIDPLRPLSNLLWGYLQDELNRLSVSRRAYEYAHGLGLQLVGKAVPEMHPADVRTQFLPAFHDLLRLAWTFFREDDDKTVQADAFPMLNSLRELHFVISEGAHNQFGDLPMRARIEMLMQQWILGRPEMRDFLRGRTMVPYPESWMDRVDAMKALQGWNDASVINYSDLATYGEKIILSVRYGSWSTTTNQDQAANWARKFRSAIQRYTHALRIVSGIDLSVGDVNEVRTATERYAQNVAAGRMPTPGGTFTFPPAPPTRALPARPGAENLLRPAQPAGTRLDGRQRR